LVAITRRITVGLLVVGAALLGFLTRGYPELSSGARPRERVQPRVSQQGPARALPEAELAYASVAVPRLPNEADAQPPAALPHAHPITPQHERIYRENNLTFALDAAVDLEDVADIRRLLAIYREEFPEDALVMQQGYEIIANCLERTGEPTRAAAQSFYDTEIASTLRRHVRRHCLERR